MKRRQFLQSSIAAGLAAGLPSGQAMAAAIQALSQVTANVQAISNEGAELTLEQAAVQELSDSLRGRLLLPGMEGYDSARRVLNAGIDKHPALIVQPAGAADIMNAVNFARERALLLAVKCGGHSYGGKSTCDGGMQIDLSSFRNGRVDPAARKAYIAGGSLLAALDQESMAHGLVTTAGTVSHTGVGGLTLGGGFGRLARRFGLALDNVSAVDIVTADGQQRHASADENPDLYWGVRGGGGNFGIVTNFEFQLHPMHRTIVGGDVVFPLTDLRSVLSMYADYSQSAPDELYLDFVVTSELGSTDGVVVVHVCWSGDPQGADAAIAPVLKAGTPLQNGIRAQSYVAIQQSWDRADPRNEAEYLKSGFINAFPGTLIDAIVEHFDTFEERSTTMFFQHSGGAIGRVAQDATAFAHRKSIANMFAVTAWPLEQDQAAHVAWIREYWSHFEPFIDGWYTNEVAEQTARAVNRNYQGNYDRMVQVKTQYDPHNLFRLNANVQPA